MLIFLIINVMYFILNLMLRKVKEIRNSIIQLHVIKINVGLQTLLKSLAANPLW
jgi:hypothetical protein